MKRLLRHIPILLLLPLLLVSCTGKGMGEGTKEVILYVLIFLEVAFLAFVFLTRYFTRHEPHDHGDEEE